MTPTTENSMYDSSSEEADNNHETANLPNEINTRSTAPKSKSRKSDASKYRPPKSINEQQQSGGAKASGRRLVQQQGDKSSSSWAVDYSMIKCPMMDWQRREQFKEQTFKKKDSDAAVEALKPVDPAVGAKTPKGRRRRSTRRDSNNNSNIGSSSSSSGSRSTSRIHRSISHEAMSNDPPSHPPRRSECDLNGTIKRHMTSMRMSSTRKVRGHKPKQHDFLEDFHVWDEEGVLLSQFQLLCKEFEISHDQEKALQLSLQTVKL
jgi:hypothetical protein